jgi:amino acid transporter
MLFSQGIGLGFHTFMTAANLRGMKPSPRINLYAPALEIFAYGIDIFRR